MIMVRSDGYEGLFESDIPFAFHWLQKTGERKPTTYIYGNILAKSQTDRLRRISRDVHINLIKVRKEVLILLEHCLLFSTEVFHIKNFLLRTHLWS